MYNQVTAQQEKLRVEAEEILNNDEFTKKEQQEKLEELQVEFEYKQRVRNLFRDHKSFGNKFVLLQQGTEAQQVRYEELKQQAIENIRTQKDQSADFMPDSKDVMRESYNLFVQDVIMDRVEQANKSKGVNIEAIKTNEEAIKIIQKAKTSKGVEIPDLKKESMISALKRGELNGVDNLDGVSYVFMQNAIANEKTSTSVHEPGHEVFREILKDKPGDFTYLKDEITNWLSKNDPDMLAVMQIKMSTSEDPKVQTEEFVMEFLEQIDQGNINFEETKNKNLASLFGFMSSKAMGNNNFKLDLKGQNDAISFLVNLAGKIKTGTLTEQDIKEARETDIISKTRENTGESNTQDAIVKESSTKKQLVAENKKLLKEKPEGFMDIIKANAAKIKSLITSKPSTNEPASDIAKKAKKNINESVEKVIDKIPEWKERLSLIHI